jgi:L-seryl-tRNA(Ser) seleniumtransferase
MAEKKALLRGIPKVDELLGSAAVVKELESCPRTIVLRAVREELEALRSQILQDKCTEIPSVGELADGVALRTEKLVQTNLRRVINATGVILHTNLGRAPLCKSAVKAIAEVAEGYSNLEYNLQTGARGNRNEHIEDLLCTISGAEAALVVNNNAAALLLALFTFAKNKKILVSRGELVEIGDSFRIPDIMEQSGGRIAEVGTTNKTHLRDYEDALKSGDVGAILKVHTSNYKIVGFTEDVSIRQLAELGEKQGVPVLYDLGSGAILDAQWYPFHDEPTAPQAIRDGADIVMFSGDKLLGGPQCGILLGNKEKIGLMRKNPLTRALRIDKLSLAALEATLRLYTDPEHMDEIPVLHMMRSDHLEPNAEELCRQIREQGAACEAEVIMEERQIGGGSVPGQALSGYAVAIRPNDMTVAELEQRLRGLKIPVIARIAKNQLLLDVCTIQQPELPLVARAVAQCAGGSKQ